MTGSKLTEKEGAFDELKEGGILMCNLDAIDWSTCCQETRHLHLVAQTSTHESGLDDTSGHQDGVTHINTQWFTNGTSKNNQQLRF
ncbi:hypothetical protein Pmani_000090 [Petrolisthes manimaculis]|uniref:Uncharacterized protein n=1 Tax=Petrolisthes manimaculis TaxID=1843537 RepID=A0AAE1ULM0_9EUCA|nr:hypothetical protein Pmani_000090 [Petrolisthes manimaculis]